MPCSGTDKVVEIVRRLRLSYEMSDLGNKADPVDELIYILLSARTRGTVFEKTYDTLHEAFPDWEDMLQAGESKVGRLLAGEGLQDKKSTWLVAALSKIKIDQGKLDLSFLETLSDSDAEQYLTGLDGVGVKSARCILMYTLGRSVLPVDAHLFRLLTRTGVLPPGIRYRQSHNPAQDLVPPNDRHDLHVLAVIHGRSRCLPGRPRCGVCPLLDICGYGLASVPGGEEVLPAFARDLAPPA